jgi:hypothetical protein
VRGRLGILAAAAALGPAACGGGDTRTAVPVDSVTPAPTPAVTVTATATPPEATAPSAPSPPPDAPSPSPTSGEGQAGGGGDEAAARVPVELTVGSDGTVTPPTVSVPAFLALELRVRNRTAGTLSVTMEHADPPGAFEVGAGKTGTRRLAGVRPGRYVIAVAGAGRATLVAGAEPGP